MIEMLREAPGYVAWLWHRFVGRSRRDWPKPDLTYRLYALAYGVGGGALLALMALWLIVLVALSLYVVWFVGGYMLGIVEPGDSIPTWLLVTPIALGFVGTWFVVGLAAYDEKIDDWQTTHRLIIDKAESGKF